ncbi:Glycosyl transferase, group 2 family protein [Vibrio chagasii]|nr:Glycosyl transferase, group 2 family protein [Vibrio chagasii]
MLISLVLCTVGRTIEVENFIDSIITTKCNVELIIVDQNKDNKIKSMLEVFSFPANIVVKHIRPNILGLSKARNIGIKYVTGDVFAFPDDDCTYDRNVLDYVESEFFCSAFDFFSCKTHEFGSPDKALITCPEKKFEFSMSKRVGCSFTLFFRNTPQIKGVKFDEKMGVGAGTYYGSGEETDYITQLIYLNCQGYYEPNITVFHDAKEELFDSVTLKRLVCYGGGYSYHIKKNFRKLGFLYSIKLLLAIPRRILRNFNKKEELIKAISFSKGTFNGLFR